MKVFKNIKFGVLIFFVPFITSCGGDDATIVNKIISPDKELYVSIYRNNIGDATTPTSYSVYLEDDDNKFKKILFKAYKLNYLDVKWKNNNTIIIYYESNKILKYNNFIYINNNEYLIQLIYTNT